LLVLGLAEASAIPAADARARALDDYAGVALMTFSSLVLLLPVGFLLVSVAHPDPGPNPDGFVRECSASLGSLWQSLRLGGS